MLSLASLRTGATLLYHVLLVGAVIKAHLELSSTGRHRELKADGSPWLVTPVELGEIRVALQGQADELIRVRTDTEARLDQQANATRGLKQDTSKLRKKLEGLLQTHRSDPSWTDCGNATVDPSIVAVLDDIQELPSASFADARVRVVPRKKWSTSLRWKPCAGL